MKKIFNILFVFFSLFIFQDFALATEKGAANESFTPGQIKELEKTVRDYLLNNPTILIDMSKKLQQEEMAEQKKKIMAGVIKNKHNLFDTKAPGRLALGNPQGKIILVEFTQHQCRHCKEAAVIMDSLLNKHPEIQFIAIYWPFFGEDAAYTAKLVLAAQKQNKAKELNEFLYAYQGLITKKNADALIKSVAGLDIKKLYTDMAAMEKELDSALKENFKLAQNINITGTPALAFANRELTKFSVLPGQTAQFEEDLAKALNEVK